MTLETRAHLWPSVASRQGIRGPLFLSLSSLCLYPYVPNLWGFSFCSTSGLSCENVGVACCTPLARSPMFCFWQRCQEVVCELTGLSSAPSILPAGTCCPDGSESLTDHYGNRIFWSKTLLELKCKTIRDIFYILHRLGRFQLLYAGFQGDHLTL